MQYNNEYIIIIIIVSKTNKQTLEIKVIKFPDEELPTISLTNPNRICFVRRVVLSLGTTAIIIVPSYLCFYHGFRHPTIICPTTIVTTYMMGSKYRVIPCQLIRTTENILTFQQLIIISQYPFVMFTNPVNKTMTT